MNQEPLKNQALRHYDELYPGKNFMEIRDTRDGSRRIVGTTRSLTLEPLYVELPDAEDRDRVVAEIVRQLDRKYEQRRYVKGGYITAYHAPEDLMEV